MGTPASSIGARHTNASRMAVLEASLAPIGGRYRTPPVVLAGLGGVSVLAGRLHSATQHPPDRFFPAAISPRRATGSSPSAYGCSRSHSARGPHRPLRGGQLQQALLRRPDPGPARRPSRHGRAWTPDHGGHRLPRCPRRRNRRRADPTTAPPRSRGRTARPAHRAALRAVTCPGVHRSGVGQRLGRGQQHDDAGIAAPRVRGSRRAARPHRDDTLTWAFVERPSGLEPEAQALRGRQRSCWAVPCCRTRSRFPRSEPMPRSGCPHPVLHGPRRPRSPCAPRSSAKQCERVDSPLPTPCRHRLSRPHRRGGSQDSRAPRPFTWVSAAANGRLLRGTGGPQASHLAGRAGLELPGRGTQLPDCGW